MAVVSVLGDACEDDPKVYGTQDARIDQIVKQDQYVVH